MIMFSTVGPGLTTFLVLKNIRVNQNCANQITFIKSFLRQC